MQTVCYPLIHAKLRQFLRKLAGGPGWIRIPLLGSSPARDFSSHPILHQLLQQMLIYRAVVESVARDSASQALNKRPIIVKPSVRIRRWIFTESMRARPKDIEREVRFRRSSFRTCVTDGPRRSATADFHDSSHAAGDYPDSSLGSRVGRGSGPVIRHGRKGVG